MNTNEINKIFSELAQYTRLQEETAAIIEGLKNQIKDTMTAAGVECSQYYMNPTDKAKRLLRSIVYSGSLTVMIILHQLS